MTQKIDQDWQEILQFYANYPMFNPKSPHFQKPAFDMLNAWVDMNPTMDPTDPKQFAAFVRWLQKPPQYEAFVQQVKAAGGVFNAINQPLYDQFVEPMVEAAPAPAPEPSKAEEDSDPIKGLPLPHPIERLLVQVITGLDPDAEVTARLVFAYVVDVGTSVVTAIGNTMGQSTVSTVFAIVLNVIGSFAEIIFRYGITMLIRGFKIKTKTAGDLGLLFVYLVMCLLVVGVSAGGYVYNLIMTISFFHKLAPESIVFFDFPLPVSIGGILGLVIVAIMSVIQLEYVLKQTSKN